MPKKIDLKKVKNHLPNYNGLDFAAVIKEANRCLVCEDAPCSKACPKLQAGEFIRQIKFGNLKGALRTVAEHHDLKKICASLPQIAKPSEKACVLNATGAPINIAGLLGFLCEQAKKYSLKDLTKQKKPANLSVKFCGVKFENPFLLASSPVSNQAAMCARAYEAGWAGAVFKTLNNEKTFKVIMPSPRLNAYSYGDQPMFGLQNTEQISDRPLKDNLKDLEKLKKNYPKKILIASIMGLHGKDWRLLAKAAEDAGADMLELNFSCPQMATEKGGHRIGQDYSMVALFTEIVKKACHIPVIAKMTPNITDMIPVALAAKDGGADAISAINTLRAISDIDLETFTPLPNMHGKSGITGFSGAAVKPIALRFIAELFNAKNLALPISGMGGIETWRDALQFILLGADTLQVTTAVMQYGYGIVSDLIEGLSDFLIEHNFSSLAQLKGKAAKKLIDPEKFTTRFQVISEIDEQKCIGCGRCYVSCRDGANQAIIFNSTKRKAQVNQKRCIGCTLCKLVCPVKDCVSIKEIDTENTEHAAIF